MGGGSVWLATYSEQRLCIPWRSRVLARWCSLALLGQEMESAREAHEAVLRDMTSTVENERKAHALEKEQLQVRRRFAKHYSIGHCSFQPAAEKLVRWMEKTGRVVIPKYPLGQMF